MKFNLKRILAHYRNNPGGYWFKRNIFWWGWVPVKWEGWVVFVVSVASIALGIYFSQAYDTFVAAVLGIIVGVALTLGFGHWKGAKACFMWGLPEDKE
jgi:hypothetical protein